MYRVLVLVVLLTVISAETHDNLKECYKLGRLGIMQCCKTELPVPKVDLSEIKKCMGIPHQPNSCEHDICIGKKRGYVSDDGTIDKAALEKTFSEDFESVPTLVKAVKENCLGDLDAFGTSDDCKLIKIKKCVQTQAINDCKEWDDNGPCTGIKYLVKECMK